MRYNFTTRSYVLLKSRVPNIAVKWEGLQPCIKEVLDSNLSPETESLYFVVFLSPKQMLG
jgi:hypothetical protein